MPASALQLSADPVAPKALPLQARDELAGNLVQVPQEECEGLAWRLLHRQHPHLAIADQQMVPVALDRRVRHEVVQVRVVSQARRVDHCWRIVDEAPEEPERLRLRQPHGPEVAHLNLECLRLVVQRRDGPIQLGFEHSDGFVWRQPRTERGPGGLPEPAKLGRPPHDVRRFVDDHQVQRQFVQVVSTPIEVSGAPLNRLVRHRIRAGRRRERPHPCLEQVLVDTAALIEEPQRGLEPMHELLALGVGKPLVVHAVEAVDHSNVPRLGEERGVVHEAPERKQPVHTAGVRVIPEDAAQAHHGATSRSMRSCLAGS